MRVWCGVVVVVATLALSPAGGCDRRNKGAAKSAGAKTASHVVDQAAPRVETDPAKLLFSALALRDTDKVGKLIEQHPDLLNKPINNTYPLVMVCEYRSLPLVKAMVDRGADLKVRTPQGLTPIWAAVNSDSLPVVKYLVEKGADVKTPGGDGETLLWAAQSKAMVMYLVGAGLDPKHRDNVKDMAIHEACRRSNQEVVEAFLDLGVGIEEKGHWDMPPLHFAVTTETGDPRPVVRMLIDRGANIHSRGFNGNTLIHECAFYNRIEMAQLLLTQGAKVAEKNAEGKTPMDMAHLAGKDVRVKVINLLISFGAEGTMIAEPQR